MILRSSDWKLAVGLIGVLAFGTSAATPTCAAVHSRHSIARHRHATQSADKASPLGLYVDPRTGTLMHDGRPFRGIGVNYFDIFNRGNSTYLPNLAYLHSKQIPFIRFAGSPGYWPSEFHTYLTDKNAFFRRFDALVHNAEANHVGLVPALFFNATAVCDVEGEHRDQWANPESKTVAFMRMYVKDVVSRYKNSPAIWGWAFSNEENSDDCDLLSAAPRYRSMISVANGTPAERTANDDLTSDQLRAALALFAQAVRKYDKSRVILSGNDIVANNQYHRAVLKTWDRDSSDQFGLITKLENPDPIDTITMHLYPKADGQYFTQGKSTYLDILKVEMSVARSVKKPLMLEEFGACDESGVTTTSADFRKILDAVVKAKVPYSAMWVYDFSQQNGSCNVTQTNSRAYQLADVVKANAEIRAQMASKLP